MDQTNKTEQRLQSIDNSLKEINITLIRQEHQLSYHIRRTDLLEDRVQPLESFYYKALGGISVLVSVLTLIKLFGGI